MNAKEQLKSLRDIRNKNIYIDANERYRLLINEADESKTAYYFTAPIISRDQKKLTDLDFKSDGNSVFADGTNAHITVAENTRLENSDGYCVINIGGKFSFTTNSLSFKNGAMFRTLNGIAYMTRVKDRSFAFVLKTNRTDCPIRTSNSSFCLMKEKFQPFVSVSCIGVIDNNGHVCAPISLQWIRSNQNEYKLNMTAPDDEALIMFEINMYEPKIIQDTTVESVFPFTNNAFGGVAFLGDSSSVGKVWLYSKSDFQRLGSILDSPIEKVVLHVPRLNTRSVKLCAYPLRARFCSFGSNWENKVSHSDVACDGVESSNYYSFDLSRHWISPVTQKLTLSNGIVIKAMENADNCVAVATADNSFIPQILEVRYR